MHLEAFLALHRSGVPLARDVIFMATADEEAGGHFGAGWIVANRPDAFRGAKLLLTEGGRSTVNDGHEQFGIEVTQKVPLWLRLTATDRPTHGSTPRASSSVTRLVRALDRLQTYRFEPRVLPAVDAYFKGLAPGAPARWRGAFADLASAVKEPETLAALQSDFPGLAALTRNTCSITRLEGSPKINVVPPEARAELDCRLLPDQDRDAFLAELRLVLNDPGLAIEQIMAFTPGESPSDTPFYRAIVDATRRQHPRAEFAPAVLPGFTDSHFFRDLGIDCYGFSPFLVPLDELSGVHGNDERIPVESVRQGTALMTEVVRALAAAGR
jgi:acetylornithine deacetylase/succinyl-diaminopimelate desuccinylase-like protein